MLYDYFIKNRTFKANRTFVTLYRFKYYGLTANQFSTNIAQKLSKKNHFSIGRCRTIISYPVYPFIHWSGLYLQVYIQIYSGLWIMQL